MTQSLSIIAIVAPLVTICGPIFLGTLTVSSTLLYALAFSVVFFIQELFLVLPKALTPDLRPTLFHNNHDWDGDNPLASLFQGTGALASAITAVAFALWLKHRPPSVSAVRLFVIWMMFHGFFQSLPQVVVGAIYPPNDVGMAMDYLHLTPAAKSVAAFIALALIAVIAVRLTQPLLELARTPANIDSAGKRTRFVFRVATLPALLALPLIILFRIPGTVDQVVIVPLAVTVIGISWIQAAAWCVTAARPGSASPVRSLRYPFVALVVLFLVFQLVLRPGIAFY
jgi:hypothetical protein